MKFCIIKFQRFCEFTTLHQIREQGKLAISTLLKWISTIKEWDMNMNTISVRIIKDLTGSKDVWSIQPKMNPNKPLDLLEGERSCVSSQAMYGKNSLR